MHTCPYCDYDTALNFNDVFQRDYMLVRILLPDIFISMFIKTLLKGVWRHEYPSHAVISPSVLASFSANVIHQSQYIEGYFRFQYVKELHGPEKKHQFLNTVCVCVTNITQYFTELTNPTAHTNTLHKQWPAESKTNTTKILSTL
jgi:hypothetical protein